MLAKMNSSQSCYPVKKNSVNLRKLRCRCRTSASPYLSGQLWLNSLRLFPFRFSLFPFFVPSVANFSSCRSLSAVALAKADVLVAEKSVKSYEPEPVNVFFCLIIICFSAVWFSIFARRPLCSNTRGRGVKMRRDLYFRLASHTPIRAHHKACPRAQRRDGTQNCLRQKGPILSDVISANGGLTLHRPGSFL